MSLRNKATALLLDQIDTVQVTFDSKYIEGLSKLYTYKAKKGVFKANDLALILDHQRRFKIVLAVIVDSSPRINVDAAYDYQWLVQRINTEMYDKCIDAENVLIAHLQDSKSIKRL